jgi:hypothetical protein
MQRSSVIMLEALHQRVPVLHHGPVLISFLAVLPNDGHWAHLCLCCCSTLNGQLLWIKLAMPNQSDRRCVATCFAACALPAMTVVSDFVLWCLLWCLLHL